VREADKEKDLRTRSVSSARMFPPERRATASDQSTKERDSAHQPYPSGEYFGERVPPAVHGKRPEEAGPEPFLPSPDHDGKQKAHYTWQHLVLRVEGDYLTRLQRLDRDEQRRQRHYCHRDENGPSRR
jgi:hypothetical protein